MKFSLVQSYFTERSLNLGISRSTLPVLELVIETGFLGSFLRLHPFGNDLLAWTSFQSESHLKKDAAVVVSPQVDLLMSFEAGL